MDSRDIIENVFNSWQTCKNNHTYIENISNRKIILDDESLKKTIYIENCNFLDINLINKFNHLILINCQNIILHIKHTLISGMTILHSKNITIKVDNTINFSEVSNSDNCIFIYNKLSSDNTYINTNFCYNINFIISDNFFFKKYMECMSFFSLSELFYINELNLIRLI